MKQTCVLLEVELNTQPNLSFHNYRASQAVSPKPLKFTLPEPLTIMDAIANCFYADLTELNTFFAATINKELLALEDAGCSYI